MLSAIFHFIKEKAINKSRRAHWNEPENYHLVAAVVIFFFFIIIFCTHKYRQGEETGNDWQSERSGGSEVSELVAYFCALQLINLQGNNKSSNKTKTTATAATSAIVLRFMFYCFVRFLYSIHFGARHRLLAKGK